MARDFWGRFFDTEYRQREDIDDTADRVAQLQHDTASLEQYQLELRNKLMQLATTVDVLLDILVEHDLLDEIELSHRVELRLHPPPPRPDQSTGSPYRDVDGAAPPPRPVPTTMCTQCMKQVPLPSTQITANGVVCDPCFTHAL